MAKAAPLAAQGDPVKLRTFFEAFNEDYEQWIPADYAPPQQAALVDIPSGGGRPHRRSMGSSAGSSHPVVAVVTGCASSHPRELMEALVSALNSIPTEFIQGKALVCITD